MRDAAPYTTVFFSKRCIRPPATVQSRTLRSVVELMAPSVRRPVSGRSRLRRTCHCLLFREQIRQPQRATGTACFEGASSDASVNARQVSRADSRQKPLIGHTHTGVNLHCRKKSARCNVLWYHSTLPAQLSSWARCVLHSVIAATVARTPDASICYCARKKGCRGAAHNKKCSDGIIHASNVWVQWLLWFCGRNHQLRACDGGGSSKPSCQDAVCGRSFHCGWQSPDCWDPKPIECQRAQHAMLQVTKIAREVVDMRGYANPHQARRTPDDRPTLYVAPEHRVEWKSYVVQPGFDVNELDRQLHITGWQRTRFLVMIRDNFTC
jgi:hypothetical protein